MEGDEDVLTDACRHRKPTTDENGRPASPKKPATNVEENFGTIF